MLIVRLQAVVQNMSYILSYKDSLPYIWVHIYGFCSYDHFYVYATLFYSLYIHFTISHIVILRLILLLIKLHPLVGAFITLVALSM